VSQREEGMCPLYRPAFAKSGRYCSDIVSVLFVFLGTTLGGICGEQGSLKGDDAFKLCSKVGEGSGSCRGFFEG
jgi:hypothetical protein